MIQGLTQYSLNKDLEHLKWQPPRSWISSQYCQVSMDKQQTQHRRITKWKCRMLPNFWKFQSQNVQTFGFVYHDINGLNHVQYWRPSLSSWTKSVRSSFWQDYYGKCNLRKCFEARLGESFQMGLLIRTPSKRMILIFACWWKKKKGWKGIRNWSDVESTSKEVDLGEPTSLVNHLYLGCTPRQYELSKDVVDNSITLFESRISAGWTEKLPYSENFCISSMVLMIWKFMQINVWIDIVSLQTRRLRQLYKVIYSMHRWPPLQRRRNEICWRIVTNMLSNCSKMFLRGKNWTTRYFMVSKKARTIHNKMDQSLWQTPESIDFTYSSYMWIQTILSCG